MKRILKERDQTIDSFLELSEGLMMLHGKLGSVIESFHMQEFYRERNISIKFQEMSAKSISDLGIFWEQSEAYEKELENYYEKKLYNNKKDQVGLLTLYVDTRDRSITSLKNLIRFLINEGEGEYLKQIRKGVKQVIKDTNLYIKTTWNVVKSKLAKQIILDNKRGINTQEKYKLFPLELSELCPREGIENKTPEEVRTAVEDLMKIEQ
jgi:hypothetical protein